MRKQLKISSSFTLSCLSTTFCSALKPFRSSFWAAFTLWGLLDKFCLESFFECFCLIVLKIESSSLSSSFFSFFPSVSELSPLNPVLLGHAGFSLILNFSDLRNRKFRFFLPLLISFFALFLFGHFVLLILLPDVILFGLVPNSLLSLFLHVLIFNNVLHFVSSDFGQWIKFRFYIWVFDHTDVLRWIFEVFFHRFLDFFIELNFDTINSWNR